MKLALSPQQYFSLDGKPLVAGRLKVHLHDSDTLATLYTLEGGSYVQASNPVVLDNAGEVHDTVWTDEGLYDVDVEQRNDDGTFVKISEFQFGLELPEAVNDTVLNGIEALHHADPALGIVSVYGYDSNCVAPMRQYIWDSNCSLQADDGVIVASEVQGTGRWLLLWDDEKLPCTVYGIVPGHEQNLNAFLSYPETVGRWNIATPPVLRFIRGDYTTAANVSTLKSVYFDRDARFTAAKIWCRSVEVEANTAAACDFVVDTDAQKKPVHSSWFRTPGAFWGCGAMQLVVDPVNYFVDNEIDREITLTGATVEGCGPVSMTFTGTGRLVFNRCDIGAVNVFNPGGSYRFTSMRWSDGWWTRLEPGYFNFGDDSNIEYPPDQNPVSIDDFGFVQTYARLLRAYDIETLDLAGRSVTDLSGFGFSVVRNGRIDAISSSTDLALSDCVVGSLTMTAGDLTVTRCTVTVDGLADSITAQDSYVVCNPSIDCNTTMVDVWNGTWIGRINPADYDDLSKGKQVRFRNCSIYAPAGDASTGASNIRANLVDIGNCVVNTPVVAYPMLIDGSYYMDLNFAGNTVQGAGYLQITHSGSPEYAAHPEVHDVIPLRLRIVDNQFNQADLDGVKMPFYSTDRWYRFWAGFGNNYYMLTYTYEYWGNSGKCPLACPPRMTGSNSTSGPSFTYNFTTYYIGAAPLDQRVFCVPFHYGDDDPGDSDHHKVGFGGMICGTANTVTFSDGLLSPNMDKPVPMRQPTRVCLLPSVCLAPDELPDDGCKVYYGMVDLGYGYSLTSVMTPTAIDRAEAPHDSI